MTYCSPSAHSAFRPTPDTNPVACCLSLRDASSDVLTREVLLLRDCIEAAKKQWGFDIRAAVVLPSEMQLLGVFDAGPFGIKQALAVIQATFERHLPVSEMPLWDGPAAMTLLSWNAVPLRTTFIEAAPVRAGLVDHPSEWRFSTAYRAHDAHRTIDVA